MVSAFFSTIEPYKRSSLSDFFAGVWSCCNLLRVSWAVWTSGVLASPQLTRIQLQSSLVGKRNAASGSMNSGLLVIRVATIFRTASKQDHFSNSVLRLYSECLFISCAIARVQKVGKRGITCQGLRSPAHQRKYLLVFTLQLHEVLLCMQLKQMIKLPPSCPL